LNLPFFQRTKHFVSWIKVLYVWIMEPGQEFPEPKPPPRRDQLVCHFRSPACNSRLHLVCHQWKNGHMESLDNLFRPFGECIHGRSTFPA
jgi:hypothetical protein